MLKIVSAALTMLVLHANAFAYKLVEVPGRAAYPMKWGASLPGSPAVIRFGLARSQYRLDGGLHGAGCETISPLNAVLAEGGLSEEEFLAEVQRGVSRWSAVAGITFEYVREEADADVLIGTQTNPHGTAYVNMRITEGARMLTAEKGIICLNPRRQFIRGNGDCKATYNIAYVLSHEFGHILGLDHPAPGGTLMAFRCSEEHVLSIDEENGARFLYGPHEK
jgi:hypothetical protein